MLAKMRKGTIPPFARVLVETTGLADPAPICQMLLNNPLVSHFFRLDTLITTTDAVHGCRQLERAHRGRKQAALADRLLLTKTDLATRAAARHHWRPWPASTPTPGASRSRRHGRPERAVRRQRLRSRAEIHRRPKLARPACRPTTATTTTTAASRPTA
jgi:G3E family GTPase